MSLDLVTFTAAMINLGKFSPNCHIAVAVSGGPDSMTLCHLLKEWLRDYPQSQMTALIVDHGLRSESTDEAELTQQRLKDFDINSVILKWTGEKPATRIQERARQARYKLLENWCYEQGVIYLFTGHHFDDQWETVVSRLQKKSDIRGLRGILPVSYRRCGRILRPLLEFSKHHILDYATLHALPYAIDPSNQNLKYQRSYLRQNRPQLEEQNLSADHIKALIKTSTLQIETLRLVLSQFVVQSVLIDPLGYFKINKAAFNHLDQTLKIEFLRSVCHCMVTTPYPLPKQKALTAIQKIESDKRTTLAGWYIISKKDTIIIVREPRGMLAPIIESDGNLRQDRFIISQSFHANSESKIAAPSYILNTLPSHLNFKLRFLNPLLN
ncbi:MAG: tRNA lysidine(34) synthetase TilS [Candidatus Paracaedibacteraceae bacterium]|nr:tRNA lysidine(34) synthetase TilS [Candidatus Paracaedibacteraceae bacterium]